MQRIFVGDVQGCGDELEQLVARARADFGDEFELWLVGDLINRGPASRRVLECVQGLWQQEQARVVLGNHELALLRVAWGQRELSADDTFQEVIESADGNAWVAWLRTLPLLEVGTLGRQRFAMVHAAVAPEWTLPELESRVQRVEARLRGSPDAAARLLAADPREDADADALARLTRCRSVRPDGAWSSAEPNRSRRAWHAVWSEAAHDYAVVYGHWAMQGLHVAPRLRGLDTGCVYHGHGRDGFLTAWLPDAAVETPFDVPDERFWRIRAGARYWRGR